MTAIVAGRAILLLCTLKALTLISVQALDTDWWKTAVVYQIYPKSFKDSNNDGEGDLQGIISKLGYLKDAGIDVVWLSSIYKSPQVDDGYDISDFKDIDPFFGTLDDFDQLIQRAKKLGIRIVMDFCPNHSSKEHKWFRLSENRTKGYEDFYMWANANKATNAEPNNWISVFKYSAWTWSDIRRQYYLHQFTEQQPDFNYRSAAVGREMKDILTFWMNRGVAGFRVAAISHLFETGLKDEPRSGYAKSFENAYLDHVYTKDQPETFNMVYQWRTLMDDYSKKAGDYSRILMTEAATNLDKVMLYYGNKATRKLGAHFSFNFQLLGSFGTALAVVDNIQFWNSHMPAIYTANWLIGNHDSNRAATRLGIENVDGYNMLIALLPGVLITFNGEEIGMENGDVDYDDCADPNAFGEDEDYFYANSRDFARTPFHWDKSTNAGFNDGATSWLPVSSKYVQNNLALQSVKGTRSHFHVYKELIKLRKNAAFTKGALAIEALSDNVIALIRTSADGDGYVFVFNINDSGETVNLTTWFPSITKTSEVILTSVNSKRKFGELVHSGSVKVRAHESFVAKQISREYRG